MSDAADPIAQRALAINIDRQIYGTFAEIGAGQVGLVLALEALSTFMPGRP